jgi:hypothetical protein
MMTIAQDIKTAIETNCPGCFSLYAGYGMRGGEYVRFPNGAQETEKRNDNGRVTLARYRYSDNSTLEYRYSAQTEQYTLKTA